MIRLAIRTYKRGVLQTVERIEASMEDMENLLTDLASKHAEAMIETPGHVEIEFLDEPDFEKRFFRLGTDLSCMVNPIELNLSDDSGLEDALKKWGGR